MGAALDGADAWRLAELVVGAALNGADAWMQAELVVGAALDSADAWRLAELVVGTAFDGADAWRRGKTSCLAFSPPLYYPFTTLLLPFHYPSATPIHYIFFYSRRYNFCILFVYVEK